MRNLETAGAFYVERYGFEIQHADAGIVVLRRDDAVLHLWAASDERWRRRDTLAERPVVSGAESFLAGTSSCRIEVRDVDALFAELQPRGILHPNEPTIVDTDFGTREFHTLDLEGNLVSFFRWRE